MTCLANMFQQARRLSSTADVSGMISFPARQQGHRHQLSLCTQPHRQRGHRHQLSMHFKTFQYWSKIISGKCTHSLSTNMDPMQSTSLRSAANMTRLLNLLGCSRIGLLGRTQQSHPTAFDRRRMQSNAFRRLHSNGCRHHWTVPTNLTKIWLAAMKWPRTCLTQMSCWHNVESAMHTAMWVSSVCNAYCNEETSDATKPQLRHLSYNAPAIKLTFPNDLTYHFQINYATSTHGSEHTACAATDATT